MKRPRLRIDWLGVWREMRQLITADQAFALLARHNTAAKRKPQPKRPRLRLVKGNL